MINKKRLKASRLKGFIFVADSDEISNLNLMRDMIRIISLDPDDIRNSSTLTYKSATIG